jgi:hypothetical protein
MATIYTSGALHVHSTTAGNIPTDGRNIYVTLYSQVNNAWVSNSYIYKALTPSATPTPTPVHTPTTTPTPVPTSTPKVSATSTPTVTPTPTAIPAGPAVMLSPVPGSIFTSSSVTFKWSAGGTQTHFLSVGSSRSGAYIILAQLWPSPGVLSTTVDNIPTDGRTIYVTLGSWINGSWIYKSYTYKAL